MTPQRKARSLDAVRAAKVRREWERSQMLTLSDGGVWRYYNGSDLWECFSGTFKDHFSPKPVREDRGPLTAADLVNIGRVRLHGSAPGARPQTLHPKRLP